MNVAIAFCMGTNVDSILNDDIGQPLAAIFFNSFGEKATLRIWAVVVITQWAVWFSVFIAALLGLFAFAGDVAIMAVFSIAVIGLYVAYIIPIGARFVFNEGNFKPGPFTLGSFGLPVATIAIVLMSFITIVLLFPSRPAPEVSDMNY
ncbi:GABA-specific high-affinity permease, partial [Ceratobasidium sp. 423]